MNRIDKMLLLRALLEANARMPRSGHALAATDDAPARSRRADPDEIGHIREPGGQMRRRSLPSLELC